MGVYALWFALSLLNINVQERDKMENLCCKPSSRKINSRAESDSDCNNRFQPTPTSIQHTEPENVSNHEPSNEITNSGQNFGGDEHLNDNILVSNVDSVQQSSGPESIQPTLPEIMTNNEPSIEMTNYNENIGENEHSNTDFSAHNIDS